MDEDKRPQPIAEIRRANMLALFRAFVERQTAVGADPHGLAAEFADSLQIKPAVWGQIKGRHRQMTDRLARQIEANAKVAAGWLDVARESPPEPDEGEERFVALARAAWRAKNARGKRRLRTQMLDEAAKPD